MMLLPSGTLHKHPHPGRGAHHLTPGLSPQLPARSLKPVPPHVTPSGSRRPNEYFDYIVSSGNCPALNHARLLSPPGQIASTARHAGLSTISLRPVWLDSPLVASQLEAKSFPAQCPCPASSHPVSVSQLTEIAPRSEHTQNRLHHFFETFPYTLTSYLMVRTNVSNLLELLKGKLIKGTPPPQHASLAYRDAISY